MLCCITGARVQSLDGARFGFPPDEEDVAVTQRSQPTPPPPLLPILDPVMEEGILTFPHKPFIPNSSHSSRTDESLSHPSPSHHSHPSSSCCLQPSQPSLNFLSQPSTTVVASHNHPLTTSHNPQLVTFTNLTMPFLTPPPQHNPHVAPLAYPPLRTIPQATPHKPLAASDSHTLGSIHNPPFTAYDKPSPSSLSPPFPSSVSLLSLNQPPTTLILISDA
jgi:hypothetical protein